jgi:DNA phosphorothioation-associated DGQHR protein 1
VLNGIVVDGQHRLFSFRDLSEEIQKKYELLCTLYLDLPTPYQAYLFATINMNQRKVSKDLAYELFGYDLNDEESYKWSPEKLAVFLTRKLNMDRDSIFRNHIRLASKSSFLLDDPITTEKEWFISTASMVEGILTLITNNSKRDFDHMQKFNQNLRDRKELLHIKSSAPLRKFYIENNDLMIYTIILNYFNSSYNLLYHSGHMLYKTIGIQVQFAILKKILDLKLEGDKNISEEYYTDYFEKITNIDFNDSFFQFSGIGKTRMKNVILHSMGLLNINEIKNQSEVIEYKRILSL